MIGSAEIRDGLYVFGNPNITHSAVVNSISDIPANVWHLRLGHVSAKKLVLLHKLFPYISIPKCNDNCEICPVAKQRKFPFPTSHIKFVAAFDLLHIDIWGPNSIISMHGHRYYLTIVDDYTRHTWIFFMKH